MRGRLHERSSRARLEDPPFTPAEPALFDILVSDGEDLRRLPLSMRKANLSRLLARRVDRIFLSDFEQGEIGPDLFRHACLMGLEGIVSKHRDRPFSALGQSQEPQASRNAARYGHVLLTV